MTGDLFQFEAASTPAERVCVYGRGGNARAWIIICMNGRGLGETLRRCGL